MIMIRSLRVQMTNMLYSLQMYLTNVPNQHTNASNYLLKFIYGLRNGQASPRLSCPCFPIGDVLKQLFVLAVVAVPTLQQVFFLK
jgi:hypothetical protein